MRRGHRLVLACVTLATAACSSACGETSGQEPDTTPRPRLSLPDAERAKPASCGDTWLAGSTGRVTTDRGEVLVGATVAYCAYTSESATCLPWVRTEAGGWYSLLVQEPHRCVKRLSVRVIPPAGRRLSEAYCAPPLGAPGGVLDLSADLRLTTLDAPTSLPPLGDPTVVRTVAFADGLELTFAPDDMIEGDQYDKLSAGAVTDAERPCFLPEGLSMDALYAFGPAMNVGVFAGRPKVRFKLPNPKGLPEGTVVELFVLGGSASQLDADRPIEEGAFTPAGLGHVEGGRVVPSPGGELSVLSVVGYRRR